MSKTTACTMSNGIEICVGEFVRSLEDDSIGEVTEILESLDGNNIFSVLIGWETNCETSIEVTGKNSIADSLEVYTTKANAEGARQNGIDARGIS